ncbi:MAG: TIGR00730 family Rossman fold protein [Aliarcobacter sp.]|nr:TIGR00730 family Rossman fold protein [Aliarcobacter sp.]
MKKEKIICKEKIATDFSEGKELLENFKNNVTIFGSARTASTDKYAILAEKLAYRLSKNNINIITGGGEGIMKAANKGAFEAKCAESIGLSIYLPNEKTKNEFTTKSLTFNYFFSRKYMLVKYSKACVIFPGGFGTLDEMFEVLTLTQTGKLNGFKIYLVGCDYWKYLIKFIKKSLAKENMIDKEDLNIITLTDNIKKIEKEIKQLIE